MDMVYGASDYCVWRVRRSIVETKSVSHWQEFHVLSELAPATGIIMSAATAVPNEPDPSETPLWDQQLY